ncbi:MAG: CPBP family intramembrane metalloprotease [Candidatus Thorarchaeota archaeon]|nr:CPBP family intramembrane metalloprotease [Candidatus Thorarchaeota archaeon]
MVQATIQESAPSKKEKHSFWSSMNLLTISGIMLIIGIVWRIVDQFVLGLGDTWLNIMPSKIFPFLIIVVFFWKYRRHEIDSVLGLSRNQMRVQLAVGMVMGLMISVLIDIGGTVVYGLLVDPTYPLDLHILNVNLLGYMFLFFLTNAFLEETLFRGLLQNALKTRVSANVAIVLSAVAFGFWHAGWPLLNGGPVSEVLMQVSMMVFFTTILGLLFGIYYERFSSGQSLTGVIVAHTIFNFVNENFKIGPEPSMQGPDMVFSTPGILGVTLVMFFLTFSVFFFVFGRYKIEQVSMLWKRITEKTRNMLPSLSRTEAAVNDN